MIQRVAFVVLHPLSLTGGFGHLIRREAERLGVSVSMNQVGNLAGFVKNNGIVEVSAMHHGGVGGRLVSTGVEPRQALLECDALWN